MIKTGFQQRFRLLRDETGLNQTEFSEHFKNATGVNMTASAVSNYERGTRIPEVSLLITMSEYFDVSIDFLMGRTDDRKATVKTDDGLREDNVKFRDYSMVFDDLRAKLIQEGVLGPDEDFTPDLLRLFLLLGEDTAVKVLKSKGIDPSVLLK